MLNIFKFCSKQCVKLENLFFIMSKRNRKSEKISNQFNTPVPSKKLKTHSTSSYNLDSFTESMTGSSIEILTSPIKSANDKKDYRVIRLENGLVACLISDPTNGFISLEDDHENEEEESSGEESENEVESNDEENMSDAESEKKNPEEHKLAAASLCVGVGSFSDPDSVPGLAHFLEHMVFMGNEKYPKENHFDSVLKKRGGTDNAQTDCETTVFYFECLDKDIGKILEMWSHFFISPLMRKETMTREREAIESEFQMAIPSDTHRKEQIFTTFANPDSPASKFLWGNLKTLRDNVSDEDLYEKVHEFRKRHYSAHRMTLAIQARLPLDILQSFVVNYFSNIPSNSQPGLDFNNFDESLFYNSNFNRIYYVKPVKKLYQIELIFPMPCALHLYKSKPLQYFGALLGHEGKGSLFSHLKENYYVHSITAGNSETGIEHNSIYSMFTITITIAPLGINHVKEIIEATFSYINLLKEVGPQEWFYNELKIVEDANFRFKTEENASSIVEDLAHSMHFYPPEDYITGSNLYMEYNPDAYIMILNRLNPVNMNIMLLFSTVPDFVKYEKREKWFDIPYYDYEIPKDWTKSWKEVKPFKCFSLPMENPFVTTNFSLLDTPNDNNISLYPEKIVDSEIVELWYKPDYKFRLPYAYIYYYFTNNYVTESPMNACLLDIFIYIWGYQITEELYPANMANYEYSINSCDNGFMIKLHGYNDKLPLMLDVMINYMMNVPKTVTEKLFQFSKDLQSQFYYNSILCPEKMSKYLRLSLLLSNYWSNISKHHAIKNVTFEQFIEFSKEFLKDFHIQGLIQGNISKDIAIQTNNKLISNLKCNPIPAKDIKFIRVNQLNYERVCIKAKSLNEDNSNSIITTYFQVGPGDLKTTIMIEIILMIMDEPLFDVLRTKEQLGYDVDCMFHDTFGTLGFSINVNTPSMKCTTQFVDERIDAFINHMNNTIKTMSDKKINEMKDNLIKIKQVADVHLKNEVSRNWAEITKQYFLFDRMLREIEMIHRLKCSDVRNWLTTFTLDPKYTKKLSVQIVGNSENNSNTPIINSKSTSGDEQLEIQFLNHSNNSSNYKFLSNIEEFKKTLETLPHHVVTH